jgi:hypothetical protein
LETVKAGRAIVDALVAEGVGTVFGLPGGHVLGIYDALYDTPEIRHVLVRHEHAAASLAAAYAQLTGEPGVCLVTAGPGCTNLLTGIAEGPMFRCPSSPSPAEARLRPRTAAQPGGGDRQGVRPCHEVVGARRSRRPDPRRPARGVRGRPERPTRTGARGHPT